MFMPLQEETNTSLFALLNVGQQSTGIWTLDVEKIKDNSPLIRELFNVHKPYFIEAPRPASPDIIRRALEKALHTAGVNQRVNGLIKGKRRK